MNKPPVDIVDEIPADIREDISFYTMLFYQLEAADSNVLVALAAMVKSIVTVGKVTPEPLHYFQQLIKTAFLEWSEKELAGNHVKH